jgi:hypothetical protein
MDGDTNRLPNGMALAPRQTALLESGTLTISGANVRHHHSQADDRSSTRYSVGLNLYLACCAILLA